MFYRRGIYLEYEIFYFCSDIIQYNFRNDFVLKSLTANKCTNIVNIVNEVRSEGAEIQGVS